MGTRHVYLIEDGERHWVSAESESAALDSFARLWDYENAAAFRADMGPLSVRQVPDDQRIKVYLDEPFRDPSPFVEKPAGQWATESDGLVATTCY